jgi:hypothetical protein
MEEGELTHIARLFALFYAHRCDLYGGIVKIDGSSLPQSEAYIQVEKEVLDMHKIRIRFMPSWLGKWSVDI